MEHRADNLAKKRAPERAPFSHIIALVLEPCAEAGIEVTSSERVNSAT